MAPTFWALPELLRRPVVFRRRIAELHLGTAPLAAYLNLDVVHGQILVSWPVIRNTSPGVAYTRRMGVIVPGVVLAAGRSKRMGRAKALLPTAVPGQTFISRIVYELRAGGVDDVVVVVGPDGPSIGSGLATLHPPPRTVINPNPDAGQLSSLLTGLRAVDRPGVGGMLVTLVDVPLIEAGTVRALLDEYQRTHAPIVRPIYVDDPARHGHPVIFDRSVFDELHKADPNLGAKPVVHAHLDEAVEVPVTADGPFLDVDTPEAYERVFGRPMPPDTERETG